MNNLIELVDILEARLEGTPCEFEGLSTDTRKIQSGDLFLALRGENFDGHSFLKYAQDKGACAAVVDTLCADLDIPQLLVADTLTALGKIAEHRRLAFAGKVIGITGSSGKTSVKGMLASILSSQADTLFTAGNLNNKIGVPLTLMGLEDQSYAVIEMGTSEPGEIAYLGNLVKPDIAIVTNVMPCHLEGLGSIEKIADEKSDIYKHMSNAGVGIVNLEDQFSDLFMSALGAKKTLGFSLRQQNESGQEIWAEKIIFDEFGRASFDFIFGETDIAVSLSVPGEHNVKNALAAGAGALACGLSLEAVKLGLESYRGEKGRMQFVEGQSQSTVIDDTYNANPGSVMAAIDLLAAIDGEKFLVLGDMGELGPQSDELHRSVGVYAREQKITRLYAIGERAGIAALSFGENGKTFNDKEALVSTLKPNLSKAATVLVKGSRSSRMEDVVALIREQKEDARC